MAPSRRGFEGGPPIETLASTRRSVARSPSGWLDIVLIVAVAALALVCAGSSLVFGPVVRIVAPSFDLVLDTAAAFVTFLVAALCWVRYRERDEPVALFQTAAFVVLALANGSSVVLVLTGLDGPTGSTLMAPGQSPLYVFSLTHLLAAGLLVAGGVAALRNRRQRALPVLAGATIATGLVLALLAVPPDILPALRLTGRVPVPAITLLGALVSGLVGGAYLWAAALSRRLYRRDGLIGEAYLSVGLVFASFAILANAADPGEYTGVVTSGDLLRLSFDLILLLGIQAQAHATLSQLSVANGDLARLRVVEVERAALSERARLSRELHDGLAQNLWLAKLKVGRLAALAGLGPEAEVLTEELAEVIEAGLVDAQQAVATMRLSGEPSGTLQDLLSRSVDEFADRFGLRVEFECPTELPCLSPRAQAEALRIAQEALSNVRRHADATVVRVRAIVESGRLVVAVRDNGCGFDLGSVGQAAYGLASMRERAALIGGELSIESAPQDGTRVSLVVPLAVVAMPAGGLA